MKRTITFLALLFIVAGIFTSCRNVEFPVYFMVDGEIYETISTKGKETIVMPDNPTKDGYVFDGWYSDDGIWQKPFNENSLLDKRLDAEIYVYAKWVAEEEREDPDSDPQPEITNPTILVSTASVTPGARNVEITVAFKNNPGITSALLNITFDNSALELVSMSYNSELRGVSIPNANTISPIVAYWADNLKDIKGDFVFVTLNFNVLENTTSGEYEISVSYNEEDLFNANETNVEFDIVNGKITVS